MDMYTKRFFDFFRYFKNAFQIKGAYAPGSKKSLVFLRKLYSLRPIIFFANIDISKYILVMNTSVLVKSNIDRWEY
jgi:hypothetical protein